MGWGDLALEEEEEEEEDWLVGGWLDIVIC